MLFVESSVTQECVEENLFKEKMPYMLRNT